MGLNLHMRKGKLAVKSLARKNIELRTPIPFGSLVEQRTRSAYIAGSVPASGYAVMSGSHSWINNAVTC